MSKRSEDTVDQELPDWFGQEERSLAKLPFTPMARGAGRKNTELNAAWTGKVNGKTVQFYRTVSAVAKYGLPEFPAEEVFIGLLYYAARNNFATREVQVTPHKLLQLMGWAGGGNSYARLERSLNQLAGVLISTNALFDNETKQYEKGSFGIIDDWRIVKAQKGAPLFGEEGGDTLIARWNEVLFKQFKRGRLKMLNVREYYDLSSPVARRLYRWLDDALHPHGRVEVDVVHLAHVRLEISRSRAYPSSILQSMETALRELEETGYCRWEMVDSQTDSGKKFIFTRIEKGEVAEQVVVAGGPAQRPERNGQEVLLRTLAEMGGEEREELELEAVSRLDVFNRSVWNEKGRGAKGTYLLVLDHIQEILLERTTTQAEA